MATGGQARNHHWIPQCYLKGFSKNRSKNAKLFVVDTIGRKTFETIPRNVASARDFNRFDAPGVAPDHFESEYSRFEGLADKALERLCTTHHFGNDEDHNLILNLIALLVARNPLMRENSRQFQERALKLMMSITLATKDRYEASLTQAVRAGAVERDSDVTYESMREFVNGERYTIESSLNNSKISRSSDQTSADAEGRKAGTIWAMPRSGQKEAAASAGSCAGCDRNRTAARGKRRLPRL